MLCQDESGPRQNIVFPFDNDDSDDDDDDHDSDDNDDDHVNDDDDDDDDDDEFECALAYIVSSFLSFSMNKFKLLENWE